MKGTYWIAAALICFAGCANCGDNNVAGNNVNNSNNGTSNDPNNGTSNDPNNGTSNNPNNGTSNNPNSITNNAPLECTPEFEYESWDVTTDRRLIKACSPYIIDGSIEVSEGALLVVDPGVEIQLPSSEWIRIADGRIQANGREDDPIVFTSSAGGPAAGSWLGVRFTDAAEAGNEISHAIIEYAGQDAFNQRGCLTIANGLGANRITLTDTLFRECEQAGLAAPDPAFVEIARLSFENMSFGLSIGAETVGQISEKFTYTEVNANAISTEAVSESASWVSQGIPYRVQNSIEISGEADPVLTLEAGVALQFNNNEWLRVASSDDGGLVIAGTPEEPVVLESAAGTPSAGDWLGIRVGASVLGGTSISNMVIRHAGQDAFNTRGCVTIESTSEGRIAIDDSEFVECDQAGVGALPAEFGFESFTNNVFRDSQFGMHLSANAVSTVGTQVYDNTDANIIQESTLTRNGTWVAQDVPWRVSGSVNVGDPTAPVLTIEGGVTLQFENNEWLRVGSTDEGGLIARGTMANPIVMQSAAATPGPGDWLGVRFGADTLNGSILEYVTLEHGGQDAFNTRGSVTVEAASSGRISIVNSTFNECAQSCIGAILQDIFFAEITSNTFRNSDFGLRLSPNALGTVTDSQTYDSVGANLIDGSVVTQSATWPTQAVPFEVVDSININDPVNDPILTIEAPNTFQFASNERLRVGSGDAGGLVANGTATDAITFTSRQSNPAAGDWLGLDFQPNTLNGTLLNYVVVEYAGQDAFNQDGAVDMSNTGTSITISNSTFQNNLQTDIYVGTGSMPTLTNNTGTVTTQ